MEQESYTSSSRALESLEGLVEHLVGDHAEVLIYEDGKPTPYEMPAMRLRKLGLREGDTFKVVILEQAGRIYGEIEAIDEAADACAQDSSALLTPDEIAHRGDPLG